MLSMLSMLAMGGWLAMASPPGGDTSEGAEAVQALFEDQCTMCHDDSGDPSTPDGLNLQGAPGNLLGLTSAATGKPLVTPGRIDESYLWAKLVGGEIDGDVMPMGDALPASDVEVVKAWIESLPPPQGSSTPADTTPTDTSTPTATPAAQTGTVPTPARRSTPAAFRGTRQGVQPTTTTIGGRSMMFRIDHRFGRIGTERGAFGLDGGVIMSLGLGYGIMDGWDVEVRRSNSNKAWELGTKVVPLRQEDGAPLSLGGHVSLDVLRGFDSANPISGNFTAMLSRLWWERWATGLSVGYHLRTNKSSSPVIDLGPPYGSTTVRDRRDTLQLSLLTSVWLSRRWAIDLEWGLPIPGGRTPDVFYRRGVDADAVDLGGPQLGHITLGTSIFTGKHLFQIVFSNGRELHVNLAAPGGHTANPFGAPSTSRNPLLRASFYLGFGISRKFGIKRRNKKEDPR